MVVSSSPIEADDQAIQTILLGLPEDIYAAVDSCETAQEIWLRVQQMMKGSDIGIQEKKAKLFNEWERGFHQTYVIGRLFNRVIQNAVQSNPNGNGNLVASHAKGNATGHNGNQIRCYNCRGVGYFAKNCTVRPRRRDAAYLQTQLLIAQKEQAGIQLQAEELDLMAAAADLDEIEEVNTNCILMANLQQASTSGVDNTKTKRPQPRSNIKDDRVPSASKSSRSKNKEVEVEEHHRKLLLSRNKKHMSSECNNVKLASQNGKSKVIQICLWCVDSGCSKHMPRNLKLLINFVWKFLGTLRFENDHVAAILGFGDLQWGNILITRVYFVEGLAHNLFSVGQFCDSDLEVAFRRIACFVRNLEGVDLLSGNRTTNLYTINLHDLASASPICLMARVSSTKSWLWHQRLSHLNFDTINDLAKNDLRYVLVIVDDYSRYTGVQFLRSKDEAPEVIKTFLKRIIILLQSPVIIIRTDNGTKFKNQVLKEYFDSVGISHQVSTVRTPQQNRVVKRRNQTLVEAARTMLIFSRAPLFLWAEAIASVCFTQNRFIIHRHFNKTPYELINERKQNISFLHVFGACYPKNDREDIGKLGAKGDIGFFIGYFTDSCAFRVYNRRTKKIIEAMNVTFDELSVMDFEQRSSKPRLQSITSRQISLGLDLTYALSTITTQHPTEATRISGSKPTETVADNVPNDMFDANTFVNPFATSSTSAADSSSSQYVDPSNMHTFYQPYPHEFQWTKDHPLEQVIGEPSRPRRIQEYPDPVTSVAVTASCVNRDAISTGSAGCDFLEQPKHFSHSIIDLLVLLKNGILKSFYSFALMVIEGEVLNDFTRFVCILIVEFVAGDTVNLAFKMKGDMIINLKPNINAMMRDFLLLLVILFPCHTCDDMCKYFLGHEQITRTHRLFNVPLRQRTRYAGNSNNNNGWLEADDYLLGELKAMGAIEEVAKPVAEAEEKQVITLAVDMEEGQMDVLMIYMEEDLAMLFGEDDDFKDDDSEGFDEEEAWEVNEEWLMAPVTPPSVPSGQPPSVYEVGGPSTVVVEGPSFPHLALVLYVPPFVIEDLSTRLGNLEYGHGQLV
nr:retrovirus-related Pol polyprotein from transposon TNT 1-94 [Tanacetum cinerariifolium]